MDADAATFSGSEAMNQALAGVPDKRVEVIQRAQKLLGDPTYPPRETIHQLSELLAMRLPQE